MPDTLNQQTTSLEDYIQTVLETHGFNDLSPEDQETMFFDFMKQALIRLAAGLSPLLSSEGKKSYQDLLDANTTSQEQWALFWQKQVPQFEEVTKKILEDYALEIKEAFVKSS